MLDYVLRGHTHREVFRLLWGRQAVGSVSVLSRLAGVSFSAVHRELESMREAGLASRERVGAELHYRAKTDHPYAKLFRELAALPSELVPRRAAVGEGVDHNDSVRSWLASVGAPLGAPRPTGPVPELEEVLVDALKLSHRDAAVARVLPVTLWRRRRDLNLDRLVDKATRRDERHALGCFLELAGRFGGDPALVRTARRLRDKRRRKMRMFFEGRTPGRYASALTRRNTPREARRWGYYMNMPLDSFGSPFEKFAEAP